MRRGRVVAGPLRATPALDPRTTLRLRLLPWMVRDAATGRWTGSGRRRLVAAALGTAYLVSPVDAVPELWTSFAGLLDDGLVAAFVATSVRAATDDYVRRGGRGGVRPGRVPGVDPAMTPDPAAAPDPAVDERGPGRPRLPRRARR